jgi:hypothetical protein
MCLSRDALPRVASVGFPRNGSQVLSKTFLEKVEEGGYDSENGSPGKE